ncbi:hypothetical protein [Aidingimonas lacisalsi]|uniref:hypothetical protein n=1 Tax=Aidingimonas lacisalsi TaxID=2604086 RepID=UPI001F2780BD|nr:hypothetical protein [Aidingimonas lacisalsi]
MAIEKLNGVMTPRRQLAYYPILDVHRHPYGPAASRVNAEMLQIRNKADLIAMLEGLMWLAISWSISVTLWQGTIKPTLLALSLAGTLIIVSWGHRPMRLALRRYRIRRRRTEMWMHLAALPILLSLFLAVIIEGILSPLGGQGKMLLFNIVATAGWLVFVITLLLKNVTSRVVGSRKQRSSG